MQDKSNGKGIVFRAKAVAENKANADSVISDRKQVWMRIHQFSLPLLAMIPFAMPMWKYEAWLALISISMLLFVFLDYMNHFRHIWEVRSRQNEIIIKDDPVEMNYLIIRPDKWDIVAPYVVYVLCSMMIVGFFYAVDKYDALHSDSVIAERLNVVSVVDNKTLIAKEKIKGSRY